MDFQPVEDLPPPQVRPFIKALAAAASVQNGRLELDLTSRHYCRYRAANGPVHLMVGNTLGLNSDAAALAASDKQMTADILTGQGLSVPRGNVIFSPSYAAEIARKRPLAPALLQWPDPEILPCYVKPNTGREGRGVCLCQSSADVQSACEALFATEQAVRIEEALTGQEARVLVLDGRARLGYLRQPLYVMGDGVSSVETLLHRALDALRQTRPAQCPSAQDPRITVQLTHQNLAFDTVVANGVNIQLLPVANQSLGGSVSVLPEDTASHLFGTAVKAAAALGLRWAGVDLIWDADPTAATVLEVNASPGLDAFLSSDAAPWAEVTAMLADVLGGLQRPAH